ncbi:uncharacterized protein LOC110836712 [Zootermopsis nevadensis]|uniref:Uncharacterized protein n=1 Tax=Zootermopsis nevadensis TaxID=136037 RepID=A0A067QR11_ZOONE|nr:uncharacterized protein LOC110836712 [Zootermopsis nevadensis]KDR11854.1 hypothetical protein L798_14225 [Zootermopsis nevadensis]
MSIKSKAPRFKEDLSCAPPPTNYKPNNQHRVKGASFGQQTSSRFHEVQKRSQVGDGTMSRENNRSTTDCEHHSARTHSMKSRGAPNESPYTRRSSRRRASCTPGPKINHLSILDHQDELSRMNTEFRTKKSQLFSMKMQFLKKQDKLIKLHESLTDLHEKILKSTGKDVEVENIKIIEFCPMQETGDGQDEVNGDHVLRHEDREKPQSEKTKAADEESTESKEENDRAQSSKSQNDLNEERERDSRDRKKKVSHNKEK